MSLKLNVIDREGKHTTIDIGEGTTIRDAIEVAEREGFEPSIVLLLYTLSKRAD